MCQRDLGVPFVSFNARTGHRSSAPEDYGRFVVTLPQGPVPVSGVFPAGVLLHLLETGIQAIFVSSRPQAALPRAPERLFGRCDEIVWAVSFTSTCSSHDVTEFSAPTGLGLT